VYRPVLSTHSTGRYTTVEQYYEQVSVTGRKLVLLPVLQGSWPSRTSSLSPVLSELLELQEASASLPPDILHTTDELTVQCNSTA